jgi:enamine deaminase RidA (YjgF/YER057c/UK114 family)
MSKKEIINPPQLARPVGFSHGIAVTGGRLLFLAGQDPFDAAANRIHAPGDIVGQYEQVIKNLQAVVMEAGGTLQDVVKLNIYVTDKQLYRTRLRELGAVHKEYFGSYYPTMALFEVTALFNDEALIEMEGVARLP